MLYSLGRPFSPIYSFIMKIRATFYQKGFLKSYRSPALVISVGNLTMGGTGKTPFVQEIGKELQESGFNVAIVSRGYRGTAKNKVNLVSRGQKLLLTAEEAGDESRLHAESLPGVIVATGKDRKLPCQHVVDQLNCNAIVLDDGFQHMAVQRDINLVLFNSSTLAGNSRVFPGGELREPVSSLLRADAFVMTGTTDDNLERAKRFGQLLENRFPGRPVFFSSCRAVKVQKLGEHQSYSFDQLPSRLYGYCGIAHPQRFRDSLEKLNIQPTGFSLFRDHQIYNKSHLKKLISKAKQSGAQALITTEKDLVKIKDQSNSFPVYSLVIESKVENAFWDFFDKRVKQLTDLRGA